MKRMDEVFNLPVIAGCYSEDEVDIFDGKHIWQGTINGVAEAKAVAHAINHVDALADALELITTDYTLYTQIHGVDLTDDHSAKLNEMMTVAKAALAAYRGEK